MGERERTKERLLKEVSELRQQLDELKTGSRRTPGKVDAERKLQFMKTVCDVSSRFIGISDIDDAIADSLEDIGTTTGADRAYVFLISGDGETMSNTHEWVGEGVSPEKDNLQDLSIEVFSWSMSKLRDGQTIRIADVSLMPKEASVEKEILQAQDIKSLLLFPLRSSGEFLGFMGLDNVKKTGEWSEDHFELLRISAKIVGDSLHHNRMDVFLMQQTHDLGERVKELNCLFCITQFFEEKEISLEDVLQRTVNVMKESWQYPEETCARILLDEKEYRTEDFKESVWQQASELKVYGESRGAVEVFYCGKVTEDGQTPFLEEERELLDTIAGLIGRYCEREQSEKALLESEAKNRAFLSAIPDMKFTIDRNGVFLDFMPAKGAEPIRPANEFLGKNVFEILPEGIAEKTMYRVKQALNTGVVQIFEYRLPAPFPDGTLRDFEARIIACGDDEALAVVRDITEKKKAEDKLRMLATMDSLTEVLNRRSGLLLLRKQLQFSKRNNNELSICYLDVNHLKEINDTFGHREGDEVLRSVAKILKEEIRESDAVCRLGGDEFLIILPQCSIVQAGDVWFRIGARLKALNAIKMNPYKISLSHGFADFEPDNPSSIDEMLIVADYEMYKNKRSMTKGGQPPGS